MRTFVSVFVMLGAVAAQVLEPTDPTAVDGITAPAEPALAAPVEAAAPPPAPAAAPAAAPAVAAVAGGLANRGTLGLNLGPAFFGPGLNNPTAIRPNGNIVTVIDNYLKTAGNANLRVFVDVDGTLQFTDQFGQETEVLDPTVNEFLELGQEPLELHDRLHELRQQSLHQAIQRCETEMRQRFFTDPASFTPALLKGVNVPIAGGVTGVGVGARAVVA